MNESHPNWFYDFNPMKVLILGSFPPHQSRHAFPFYYPNKQNRFWKVMEVISGITLNPDLSDVDAVIEERKTIMRKLQMGIHDVAQEIVRKGNSSLDSDIEIIQYQDIVSIVKNHPELEKIILLGFSAKSSAAQSFLKYTVAAKIEVQFPDGFKPKAPGSFDMFIAGRKVECVILNSTSSASSVQVPQLVEQFKEFIFNVK
jgi:hypoxanthine-DNA glycosylase